MRLRTHLIALCLLATPAFAAPPFAGKGGTDVLHLTLETAFAPSADPDGAGGLAALERVRPADRG